MSESPSVKVRLPARMLKSIDANAKVAGVSRSEIIRRAAMLGLAITGDSEALSVILSAKKALLPKE